MSSSGFVPGSASNRVRNVKPCSLKAPLPTLNLPCPCFKSPVQIALALRFMVISFCEWSGGESSHETGMNARPTWEVDTSHARRARPSSKIGRQESSRPKGGAADLGGRRAIPTWFGFHALKALAGKGRGGAYHRLRNIGVLGRRR